MSENERPEDQALGESDLEQAAGGGAGSCADEGAGSYGTPDPIMTVSTPDTPVGEKHR